jgi:hypothetical protein
MRKAEDRNSIGGRKSVQRIVQESWKEKDEYRKEMRLDGKWITGFIDLGSDCVTLIQSRADDLEIKYRQSSIPKILKGFGRGECRAIGTKFLRLEIGDVKVNVEVIIVPDEAQEDDLIVGRSALDQPGIVIIKTRGNLEIRGDDTMTQRDNDPSLKIQRIREMNGIPPEEIFCDDSVGEDNIRRLQKLVVEHRECFARNVSEVGRTELVEMKIELSKKEVVESKPYRLPYAQRTVVNDAVQELLSAGVIRESTSEYASPVLLVKKKTGEERLCVDYRRLNAITKKEHAVVAQIEEQLDQLAGNNYFTTLDLACGYYQVPVAEESKHLTAFVTNEGLYEFNRVPFGLVNAPAVFTRMMKIIERRMRPHRISVYMDDILIPSKTIEEGFQKIEAFLKILKEEGLTLRLKKCRFFQRKVEYLGYEVTPEGVRPGKVKTAAVENFKRPTNVHEVRQFCGLASFFRRFIENHAALAKPLTRLLRKDEEFKWSQEQEEAFGEIKRKLSTRPILVLYDPTARHRLHTDASKSGIAGILFQEEEGEVWKTVAYYSRQTSETESKYHSYELETLAVVESVERFRIYLLGKKFEILTDCNALKATMTKKDIMPRIGRWWLKLQEFDFELHYKPGSQMQHVDALSRRPEEGANDPDVATLNVWTTRISKEDWLLTMQLQDPKLRNIRKVLTEEPRTPEEKQLHVDYKLKNERICRKVDDKLLWVVPKPIRWRVVRGSHDEMGHYGEEKTLKHLRQYYWFPKMVPFVRKYLAACVECAYHKEASGRKEGELHNVPRIPIPFKTVHMDHLGPFPDSSSRNKTTRRTPHELMFAYKPRNATQNKLLLGLGESETPETEEMLLDRRAEAVKAIEKAQEKQKLRFDGKRKTPRIYVEGELVLVLREAIACGQSRKLAPKYKGPYLVKKVLANDRYLIVDIPGAERTQRSFQSVFAADRMKPWCREDAASESSSSEDDGDSRAEDDSEVRIAELLGVKRGAVKRWRDAAGQSARRC